MKTEKIIEINGKLNELASEKGMTDNELIREGVKIFGLDYEGVITDLVLNDDIGDTIVSFRIEELEE
jgi:hypothetical protein